MRCCVLEEHEMKKWLCLLAVLALAVVCMSAAAAEEPKTSGDYQYVLRADGTAEITGYTGAEEELTIPDELDGAQVTALSRYAFSYCDTLINVTVPDAVMEIGDFVFYRCKNLKSVTLPAGINAVGKNPFYMCRKLQAISIPDGSEYLSVEDSVLMAAPEKRLICFMSGALDEVSDDPIDYCDVPEGMEIIDDYAFAGCAALVEVTIPDSVKTIGNRAFRWSPSLQNVTVGSHVTSIGERAFAGCSALKEIAIPDSVTAIGDRAFNYCVHLSRITFPAGMKEIKDQQLFTGCDKLRTVIIPEGVTTIGPNAFKDCTALSEITVPDSLTNIDFSAFSNGENMIVSAHMDSAAARMLSQNGFAFRVPETDCDVMLVCDESGENVTAVRAVSGNREAQIIRIPDGVTEIVPAAFKGYEKLARVYIPDSVTFIGDDVFVDCDKTLKCYIESSAYVKEYCIANNLDIVTPDMIDH